MSEIVESYSELGVLRAEGAFVDLKGPSHERLGLFETIGVLEELSEIVEVCSCLLYTSPSPRD